MRGVKLHQSVAWLTYETVAHLGKGCRGVEGAVDRHSVVSIDSIARRESIESNRHIVAGGGIDSTGVSTPVPTATASVAIDAGIVAHVELIVGQIANKRYKLHLHYQGIPISIGQIISDDAIL